MTKLDWQEVKTEQWSAPRPPAPNGSVSGGTDYFEAAYERVTWPDDGSIYAGITYEQKWVRIGPEPGFYPVVVSHSQYPAPAEEVAR
jgi:hypothetical protein